MKKLGLTLMLLVLAGCATVMNGFSGDTEQVGLHSNLQADYTIYQADGSRLFSGKTPGLITLKTSEGYFDRANYKIHFTRPGQPEQVVDLNATLEPWYLANIIVGGFIGYLVIDPLTGAMWTLPENVNTTFEK